MNISITFRHMDPSDAIKAYAEEKIAKLQKFLRQPMAAKVTLGIDRLKQSAEVRISSGGEHLEAKEIGEDLYASIDLVTGKLERQIRGIKGAAQAKRRGESVHEGKSLLPTRSRVASRVDGGKERSATAKSKAQAPVSRRSKARDDN